MYLKHIKNLIKSNANGKEKERGIKTRRIKARQEKHIKSLLLAARSLNVDNTRDSNTDGPKIISSEIRETTARRLARNNRAGTIKL